MERKIGVIMVDEKKIEKTARQISEKVVDAIGFDDSKPTHLAFLDGHVDGFNAGAKWAINEFLKDLWHPASEEPDVRNKTIICLYDDGSICQDYEVYVIATDHDTHNLQIGEFNWNCYAENEGIKKWCYKDELLPKKGGKQ